MLLQLQKKQQRKAEQNRSGQIKVEPNCTDQYRTEQGKAEGNRTAQKETEQKETKCAHPQPYTLKIYFII